ncbi:hypothetical protein ACJRO7_016855 [Eucalyptus globulus]|uniref:protein-serine/threonine phosphatase n=1 Tax=Eucalyptus globulus TaxID=34317 RepID=A0ABD3KZJ1_EUCGL
MIVSYTLHKIKEEEEDDEDEEEDDDDDGDEEDEAEEEDEQEESRRKVTHGFGLVEGKMAHGMEDFIVAEKREHDGDELGLYAIFDGHSGCKVAEYLQHHLFDNILSEPDFWTNPTRAIKRAYKKTNNEVLQGVVSSRGGSTAVTAVLINREKLIVANVGDSRAIICENGKAKQITVDHEPQKERELVESRGGFVSQTPGNVPRVDGQLAMTRAFGDEKVKDHITSEPDIFIENINEGTEFILLASDGLWKVMSNQEAADCIMDIDDAREASKALIKEALSRKSADDISCIVVKFE